MSLRKRRAHFFRLRDLTAAAGGDDDDESNAAAANELRGKMMLALHF